MAAAAALRQTELGNRDISPTFISSDLMSPDHNKRITAPSVGVQPSDAREINGPKWGEHFNIYGGIGKKDYMGSPQTRDLRVSRSHRHYSSGLSRYSTKIQPYRLTPLMLSACRINDQLLPPSFKKQLDPKTYVIPSAPPKQSYYSHECINELFPRHDPHRIAYTGEKALTDTTAKALQDYYTGLYDTPYYAKLLPDHTEAIKRNAEKRNVAHSSYNPDMSVAEEIIDDVWEFILSDDAVGLQAFLSELQTIAITNAEVETALAKCALPLQDIMLELDGNGYNKTEAVRKLLLPLNILPPLKGIMLRSHKDKHNGTGNGSHVIYEAFHRQHMHHKNVVVKDNNAKPPEPGIYPCWPPGLSYKVDFKKMQLKEVDVLLEGKDEKKAEEPVPPPVDMEAWKKAEIYETSNYRPVYKEYLNDVLPVHLKSESPSAGGEKSVLVETYNKVEPVQDSCNDSVHLPPLRPTSACPVVSRIPEKLGLRFKTEAHKRFHEMYKDVIPALNTKRFQDEWARAVCHSKRYFFYGYHASAFRG